MKMRNRKLIFRVFILAVILDLIGIIAGNQLLRFVFKPMIILLLMTYYSLIIEPENKMYLAALFLCFIGDVLLLFDSQLNFILGLSSFLIAHLLFIKIVAGRLIKSSVSQKIKAIIPFAFIFTALIFLLKDTLGDLLIPVIVYALAIISFGVISLLNYITKRNISSLFLVGGATFFILSDVTLAINKFYEHQEYFPVFIMVTYVFSQYMICKYMIVHENKE
tara:strand:- start:77 stop:739 length:663 start_codon:yes stop_codon:yes gene_type:complete